MEAITAAAAAIVAGITALIVATHAKTVEITNKAKAAYAVIAAAAAAAVVAILEAVKQ